VTDGSWFWFEQPDPLPQAGYQALPHPDVPAGEFAAASRNGASDKETFLHIDTSDWTTGTTVTKFVLTVKEDLKGGNVNALLADGKIRAQATVEYFAGSTEGGPYSQKPSTTKTDAADGKRATDGTWTFDLTAIASKWASGALVNSGIGLVPNVTASDNYQVVWQGTTTMTIEAEVSAPSSPSGSGSDAFPVFGSSSPPDTTPATGGTSSGSTFTPPETTDTTPTTAAPVTTAPTAAPAVAAPTRRVASRSRHGLPATFILVVLFILALAAAGAVALGDLGEPTEPRRGSVLRRLERSYE
jgi:hypothetical protein